MAKAIITCTGETINIGDKVVTEHGEIITVQGAAIGVKFFNAEKCRPVKPGDVHPTPHAAPVAAESDCIIWGS